MAKRICIDARSIREIQTGLGRYASNLIKGIAQLDPENEYTLIKRSVVKKKLIEQDNFKEISIPYDITSLKNVLSFQRVINPHKFDLYHSLYNFLPVNLHQPTKTVITSHDWMWLTCPTLAQPSRPRAFAVNQFAKIFQPRTLKRTDHVICISKWVEEEYRKLDIAQTNPKPTSVIYHGVDLKEFEGDVRPEIQAWGGKKFILSAGNSRRYKNMSGTVRAFGTIHREFPDVQLVIVGRDDNIDDINAAIREYGLANHVHFLNLVSSPNIAFLMRHAQFLSFPSFVEGFGLPIVEAYYQGCPVLTSNQSAPGELGAGAALLVTPSDVTSIAQGMRKILSDTAFRQSLIEKGKQKSREFTWENAAKKTLEVYRELL